MQQLSQPEWAELAEEDVEGVIIDVRTPTEIEQGYIPNALHMDIRNAAAFMEQLQGLDKSKNYYVYCRAGGRSAQACMIMDSLGFENTYNLMGGIELWAGEITTD